MNVKTFLTSTAMMALVSTTTMAELSGLPGADQPEARGKAIAEHSEALDNGFGDSTSTMNMVLTNAHGETSERDMRSKTLENPAADDGDKSMIIFDKPKDVRGTALLTYSHILNPDDQWLYLPAIKRVKRISSVNKSGPFMGSEFAFEDFSSQDAAKYSYKWLRDEACEDRTCHVIERRPLYEHSGYVRQIIWIDTTDYQPRKLDFYDRKDELLKTLTFSDYRLYLDKHWRAHDLYMVNHNSKKTTRLVWSEYQFKTGLDDGDFNKNSLKRAR